MSLRHLPPTIQRHHHLSSPDGSRLKWHSLAVWPKIRYPSPKGRLECFSELLIHGVQSRLIDAVDIEVAGEPHWAHA